MMEGFNSEFLFRPLTHCVGTRNKEHLAGFSNEWMKFHECSLPKFNQVCRQINVA